MTTELYQNILDYFKSITHKTEWQNHIYAVGGCCRDAIMGLPIKDIDMAVNLPDGGVRFAEWLHARGLLAQPPVLFKKFGTAKLRLLEFPEDEIELVQTRREKYTDHTKRNPETVFGTLEEDCFRRDLTINSLYFDIWQNKIIDLTGKGVQDIMNHVIRTPADPDITYDDDPLRILRCIRFSCRFGWKIEEATFAAMIRNTDRLTIISIERIRSELEKMLTSDHPSMAMKMLRITGAMRHVIPEVCRLYSIKESDHSKVTQWDRTINRIDNIENTPTCRMAALLCGLCKVKRYETSGKVKVSHSRHEKEPTKIIRKILKRLRYDREFIKNVEKIITVNSPFHRDIRKKAEKMCST